eukprot:gene3534-4035_t
MSEPNKEQLATEPPPPPYSAASTYPTCNAPYPTDYPPPPAAYPPSGAPYGTNTAPPPAPYPSGYGMDAPQPAPYPNNDPNAMSNPSFAPQNDQPPSYTETGMPDANVEAGYKDDLGMMSFNHKSVRLGKVVTVAVSIFACQTKYDFTTCGGLLFVLTLCLIFFGLFAAVLVPTNQIRIATMAYALLGALLFMGFLVFDTQLIIGGNKYEIDPEDYVFATMMLYVDIIYIFLFLLSLFGGSGN